MERREQGRKQKERRGKKELWEGDSERLGRSCTDNVTPCPLEHKAGSTPRCVPTAAWLVRS